MGMLCEYMMIDEPTLSSLMELNSKELTTKIISIEEEGKMETFGIGKIWDALHYFLTDESASNPIEGNKLSESIVGIHTFHFEEDADFITCTENSELTAIIHSMEQLNFDERCKSFNWELLKKKSIYPKGIGATPRAELVDELKTSYLGIRNFYQKALSQKCHIIVSVF